MSLSLPEDAHRYLRSLRTPKVRRSPDQHQGISVELEPDGSGGAVECATIFLTGAECKFTCAMCDLWQYTLSTSTPVGAIPKQLESAIAQLQQSHPECRWLKLYNASNFLDETSVPAADFDKIASLCKSYERIVIENHPRLLLTRSALRNLEHFAAVLAGRLEVALGLESIDPEVMALMNKRMSLDDFRQATELLHRAAISIRAFILLQPPGVQATESVRSCIETFDFAVGCNVRHCSIIPTRESSGWTKLLREEGHWHPPTASQLEDAFEVCLQRKQNTLVTADVWDWEKLIGTCEVCSSARLERIQTMNIAQAVEPRDKALKCHCDLSV